MTMGSKTGAGSPGSSSEQHSQLFWTNRIILGRSCEVKSNPKGGAQVESFLTLRKWLVASSVHNCGLVPPGLKFWSQVMVIGETEAFRFLPCVSQPDGWI